MKRIIYFGYYLTKLDFSLYFKFLNHVNKHEGISKWNLTWDMIQSSLKYNISILEYFQFNFYKLNKEQRSKYAGTGYMYEYQLEMNPKNDRVILDDKNTFNKKYKHFLLHQSASLKEVKSDKFVLDQILKNQADKFVLKVSDGKCGAEVEIHSCSDFNSTSLIEYMEDKGFDLVEEYIIQHPEIMRMSPSAVNTIRIFTQLDENDEVHILGCRFRISVNCSVDNLAAGNLAAPINENTGKVSGPAIYSDITKKDVSIHPVTGTEIVGFQIPFWDETLEMAKEAAKAFPQNRSIGWDFVVTERGPGLIEGNHDWCKLVWQLPVKQGMKSTLEEHLQKLKLKQ